MPSRSSRGSRGSAAGGAEALTRLPGMLREMIVLGDLDLPGLPARRAARRPEIGAGAAQSWLRRARRALAAAIGPAPARTSR